MVETRLRSQRDQANRDRGSVKLVRVDSEQQIDVQCICSRSWALVEILPAKHTCVVGWVGTAVDDSDSLSRAC